MTDKEIKSLARQYADFSPVKNEDDALNALLVLQWLDRDYCIVPKSKVEERYIELLHDTRYCETEANRRYFDLRRQVEEFFGFSKEGFREAYDKKYPSIEYDFDIDE